MEIINALQSTLLGTNLFVPASLEYFFIIVGVLTGAIYGCRHKMDIVGVITAGMITGYGGGIIRDLLLHDQGIYFMQHPYLVLVCIAISVFVFYFRGLFDRGEKLIFFLDIVSVGMFTLAGADKAFAAGCHGIYVVMMGLITGVFGGAVRDIIANEVPAIFKPSSFYAIASLIGAVVFFALAALGCPRSIAALACLVATVFVRYLSKMRHLDTSAHADFSPAILKIWERFKFGGR